MKRPCFALTMLLGSLAGSLAAVGAAHGQSELEPAPSGSGYEHACPYAPGESSGSVGLCEDEDTRWQTHQIEERFDYLRNYDEEGLDEQSQREPTPAEAPAPVAHEEVPAQVEEVPAAIEEVPAYEPEVPAVVEEVPSYEQEVPAQQEEVPAAVETVPAPATEIAPDYGYRSGYDGEYDEEVYRPETATEKIEPYSSEYTVPAELVSEPEIDPYWTHKHDEILNDQPETTTVEQDWAKDSLENIESWLDRLNSGAKLEGQVEESTEPAVETQSEEVVNENPTPAVEEKSAEQPAQNADPVYGAHLWDDCDLGHKGLRNCDKPLPEVTNYGVETTEVRNESFNIIEHRALLLSVAHTLHEAGVALQTASQNLSRIATEEIQPESTNDENYGDEYND